MVEDVGEVGLGEVLDGVAEFFDGGLVGPGAFGAEVGDFHVVFEGEGGGHDFAVDGFDGVLWEAALVEGDEAVEKGLFAFRGVDLEAIAFFDDADFVDEVRALGEEVEEVLIDEIDLFADVFEAHEVLFFGR